jgi:hypothetical protein
MAKKLVAPIERRNWSILRSCFLHRIRDSKIARLHINKQPITEKTGGLSDSRGLATNDDATLLKFFWQSYQDSESPVKVPRAAI